MRTDSEQGLTPGELTLLRDAETDDVSLGWVLIDLGLRGNPPSPDWRPERVLDDAFTALERLHERGLIEVGRIEYIDVGPPGRVAPVRHVAEPMDVVRERVESAIATAAEDTDWEFTCWVVATNDRADQLPLIGM